MGEQQKYLDLSSGHVTWETLNSGVIPHMIAEYVYGAFFEVPDLDDQDDDTPPDLAEVFKFARANGCHLIRFDSIGDVVEELKTYDW